MARMSIDDMLGRDPRLLRLAKLTGWSKRETAGCLVLDVWPLCYDRERPSLNDLDVDAAAGLDGFAQMMVESGLATRIKPNTIRVSGAKKRIKYLRDKIEAGRRGGVKSGESRRNPAKQNSSTPEAYPQAVGNPPLTLIPTVTPISEGAADAPPAESPELAEVKAKTNAAVSEKAARIPDRAWKAADYLRQLVLEEDPSALVSRQPWGDEIQSGWRLGWADDIRLMVERDKRTYEQIADVMHYLFKGQHGDAKFIVQSADSLREKWDRIAAVRRNQVPAKAATKPAQIPLAPSLLRKAGGSQ